MARLLLNDRSIELAMRGAEEEIQRRFAAVARQQLERVQNEAAPDGHEQFVDGVQGAPLDSVSPFGTIIFRFTYVGRIVRSALDILRETSPERSGEYKRQHAVYVDGQQIFDPKTIHGARRAVITNDVPYARVVEVGMGKRVPWSKQPQVPKEGVYRAAAAALRRKHGHLADIEFTWVGADSGSLMSGSGANAAKVRFPAILIEAR